MQRAPQQNLEGCTANNRRGILGRYLWFAELRLVTVIIGQVPRCDPGMRPTGTKRPELAGAFTDGHSDRPKLDAPGK